MLGILRVKSDVSQAKLEEIRRTWNDYTNLAKNKVLVTNVDVEFIPITRGYKLIDKTQLLHLRRFRMEGKITHFRVNNEEGD